MNRWVFARALVAVGFLIGLTSLYQTVSHIGDPDFIQVGGETLDHAYYHFFREAGGDVAAMAVILFFLFGKRERRTTAMWTMSFIVALGYYLPYWIGMPFDQSLSAPHARAEIAHVLQATLVIAGLFLSKDCVTRP